MKEPTKEQDIHTICESLKMLSLEQKTASKRQLLLHTADIIQKLFKEKETLVENLMNLLDINDEFRFAYKKYVEDNEGFMDSLFDEN